MTGTFLDTYPGFRHWAATSDVWTTRSGDWWVCDLNGRSVKVRAGVVSIHPDESGSTAWFADVLAGPGPGLVAVPA